MVNENEHWQYADFEQRLGEAFDYIFNEADGLGYHAAMGAAIDLADKYAMESYEDGSRAAKRHKEEADKLRATLKERDEELRNLKVELADVKKARDILSPMDDEMRRGIRESKGMGRTALVSQVGNGDDCLLMLSDYLLGEKFTDDLLSQQHAAKDKDGNVYRVDLETIRFEIMDAILYRRSQRYRDDNKAPVEKKGKGKK